MERGDGVTAERWRAAVAAPRVSQRLWPALAVALATTALILLPRISVLPLSALFDGDEYSFALLGRDLLAGLYPDATGFEHKPVALYYPFALASAIFGDTVLAVRAVGTVAVLVTAALLWLCARQLTPAGPSRLATAIVPLGYAGLSLCPAGLESYSELQVNAGVAGLFALLAGSPALQPSVRTGLFGAISCGACAAATILTNYLALPLLAGIAAGLFTIALRQRIAVQSAWRHGAAAALAALTTAAALLLPLLMRPGGLAAYLGNQLRFLRVYQSHDHDLLGPAVSGLLPFLPTLLYAFALLVAAAVIRRRRGGAEAARSAAARVMLLFGLTLSATSLAIAASGRFYAHYFLLAAPALLMLAYSAAMHFPAAPRTREMLAAILLVTILASAPHDGSYFERQGLRIRAHGFEGQATDVLGQLAADIDRALDPPDYLYVYASDRYALALYFLTHARATNLLNSPLHYLDAGITRAFDTTPAAEVRHILATHPKFIVRGRGIAVPRGQNDAAPVQIDALVDEALKQDYELQRSYAASEVECCAWLLLYRRKP
jgi:hypothetical protein